MPTSSREGTGDERQRSESPETVRQIVAAQMRALHGDATIYCADCMRRDLPVRFTYRCFDCGTWRCEACMGKHLGRTAAGWRGGVIECPDALASMEGA